MDSERFKSTPVNKNSLSLRQSIASKGEIGLLGLKLIILVEFIQNGWKYTNILKRFNIDPGGSK